MDKQKIREKIKNCLDLAKNNPSEEEAKAALLKAQELMLKYNIELQEEDLTSEKAPDVKTFFVDFVTLRLNIYHLQLSVIIAKNFRCKSYYSERRVYFMGFEEDSRAAMEVFSFLVGQMEVLFKDFLKKDKKENPLKYRGMGASFSKYIKRQWFEGFIAGVARAFEKQVKENKSFEIMVVTPTAVMERYNNMNMGRSTYKGHQGWEATDSSAWSDGFSKGKTALDSRSLDSHPIGIEG